MTPFPEIYLVAKHGILTSQSFWKEIFSDTQGQLILTKIIKIVATSCQILRLKCNKFDFGHGGAYSAPTEPLAGFKGTSSKYGCRHFDCRQSKK